MSNNQNGNKRRSIGGLWARQSKSSGEDFFSGQIEINGEKVEFIAFTNNYKSENPKAPDYSIFLSEPRDSKPATPAKPKQISKPAPKRKPVVQEDDGSFDDDEDVAF